MNKRIGWVDIARALGIFAIVLGHTVEDGVTMRYLYSFHIPLFFFLSGASFQVKDASFGAFVKKRAFSLLLPYALFALVSQLVYEAMNLIAAGAMDSGRQFSSAGAWGRILIGYVEANRALWFLPCLFLMGLMLYPIVKRMEAGKNDAAYAACAASVLFSILNVYVFRIREWPWKLDAALQLACFALAGRIAAQHARRMKLPRIVLPVLAAVLLALGAVSGIFWNGRIKYLGGVYGSLPVFYLSACASLAGVCLLSAWIGRCRWLEYAGRSTMAILLMHKFPILFFQWLCPVVKNWKGLPAEFVITAVSILLCLIAERIIMRICPALLGKYPKAKETLR